MKSKQYLLEKLQELSLNFKDIKIRYEHRLNTSSHLIEVIPLAIFQSNEEYMLAEANLEDEFENLFPQEDIVFVSEDSLTEIKRPDLLLGYESVTFENQSSSAELIIEGYSFDVDYTGCEYYALAA